MIKAKSRQANEWIFTLKFTRNEIEIRVLLKYEC